MRKLRNSLLLLLLAGFCLPQTVIDPHVRRVGERLACKCGSCNNTVGNCPMLQCHYASPARDKIAEALARGETDDVIVAGFVKETGLRALPSPPAEGFNLLAWAMPFIAIMIGLGAIYLWVKRMRKPAPAPAAPVDSALRRKYEERIRKETADLE